MLCSEGSDWKREYLTGGLSRNLIVNPCGEDGLEGWEVTQNGGGGWIIEDDYGKECPAAVILPLLPD